MFCSNCGKELKEDVKFCTKCGAKVEGGALENGRHEVRESQGDTGVLGNIDSQTPEKKPYLIIGILTVLLAIKGRSA